MRSSALAVDAGSTKGGTSGHQSIFRNCLSPLRSKSTEVRPKGRTDQSTRQGESEESGRYGKKAVPATGYKS